jgi:type IV secretory pathway VirB6-like protein
MKRILMALGALVLVLNMASPAWAFSCPIDQIEAADAIERADKKMATMSDKSKMGAVHALIDDAKMLLASSIDEHENAKAGGFDHARSVAKARAALGYAQAALIFANAKSL